MLFFLFISAVLAQNACYYAAGKRAGSAIIPCSSGSGVSSCCQLGDLCLSDSGCWNPTYNVTYLYGCTDSSYADANCPFKCGPTYDSAPYVGLVYCANTTRNAWSCTHPPNNDPAIAPNSAQQCRNDSIIAFAGPASLQPIKSLPTVVGGSTVFFSQVNPTSYTPVPGYTPTSTPRITASVPSSVEYVSSTATTAGTGMRTSAGSTSTSTSTASPDQSQDSSSSGLSTGAKIGIGAGVGGGAIAVAAVVIAWMVLRRRKSNAGPVVKDSEHSSTTYTPLPEKKPTGPAELPAHTKKPSLGPSELPDVEAATPAPVYTSWSRPQPGQQVYEMPADNTK